jgi:hypothetical protein
MSKGRDRTRKTFSIRRPCLWSSEFKNIGQKVHAVLVLRVVEEIVPGVLLDYLNLIHASGPLVLSDAGRATRQKDGSELNANWLSQMSKLAGWSENQYHFECQA